MRHLFGHLGALEQALSKAYLMLFLDYDGTLTPIVERPDKAAIPGRIKELLIRLSRTPGCRIAVISGRALRDVKKMVGVKGIIYAGNHGLEIEGAKIKLPGMVSPRLIRAIRQLKSELDKKLRMVKGVFVEDKALTLSVHYRLADKKDIPLIKNIIGQCVKPYIISRMLKVNPGKKVFEIKPTVKWDKGKVVLWLLARERFALGERKIFPLYIGDDITDEDAFRALQGQGAGVFVGRPRTSLARYYLKNNREVARFLGCVLKLKGRKRICRQ